MAREVEGVDPAVLGEDVVGPAGHLAADRESAPSAGEHAVLDDDVMARRNTPVHRGSSRRRRRRSHGRRTNGSGSAAGGYGQGCGGPGARGRSGRRARRRVARRRLAGGATAMAAERLAAALRSFVWTKARTTTVTFPGTCGGMSVGDAVCLRARSSLPQVTNWVGSTKCSAAASFSSDELRSGAP